jgi:hypothetical protein
MYLLLLKVNADRPEPFLLFPHMTRKYKRSTRQKRVQEQLIGFLMLIKVGRSLL